MHDDAKTTERRRFNRILFDAPAILETQTRRHNTRLIDISLKGALTKRPTDWKANQGESIKLIISLDGMDARIQMQTRLAHDEPEQIGLLCDQIDMDSITHLRRLVELNLGDSELLERELAALD